MELRQLRIFLTSAETLNFSDAAKQMFMTVSALTQNIKTLEQELGMPLFDRTSHSVFLTEAGEHFVGYAHETLRAADEAKARMQDFAKLNCGKLRVGITHAFTHMVTDVTTMLSKLYPNIEVEIRYKTVDEMMLMLTAHQLDMVLCYKPTKMDARIETERLFDDKLGVIMKKEHPLAKNTSLTIDDISKYSFALPSKGLQARTYLDEMLAKRGKELNIKVDLNVSTTLLGFVRKSNMLSVLACNAVKDYADLCAVPIADDENSMTGCIHTLKCAYCKHSQREFVRLLNEYIHYHQYEA